MKKALIFILCFLLVPSAMAGKKLPLPRFVSIKFNEVNVRTGPQKDTPIEWVFVKKGEPVEVIAVYEKWLKIRDINGEGGWAHSSVISGKRFVVITADNAIPLLQKRADYGRIIAKLAPKLRCALKKCQDDWCNISCKGYDGWIAKKFLWGVYPED